MNNKFIKKFIVILIVFISVFCFNMKVSAITLASIWPDSVKNSGNYSDEFYSLGVCANTSCSQLKPRTLGSLVYIAQDGNNLYHSYCIQPGVPIPNGTTTTATFGVTNIKRIDSLSLYKDDGEPNEYWNHKYGDVTLNSDLSKILNYTYEYSKQNITSISGFINSVKANMKPDEYQKVIAGQILVWEMRTGERTSASLKTKKSTDADYKPDKAGSIAEKNGYYMIFNKSKFATAKAEYKKILDSVYYSYYYLPGNNNETFSVTQSSAKTIAIDVNKDYEISDLNHAFKYYKIKSYSGLSSAEVVNNGEAIRIKASNAISSDKPAVLEISLASVKNNGSAVAFQCIGNLTSERKGCQDVAYGGEDRSLYIKIYTKKYSLKIKKKDEDGKVLAGAKFNICRDSSCKTPINSSPLVSGSDGTVEYKDITDLGVYYVKEIEAPKGYEITLPIQKVNLTSDGKNTVEFVDKAKIVKLTKKTVDENGNVVDLDDGCGSDEYRGPIFKLYEGSNEVKLKRLNDGEYELANSNDTDATTEIKTCNGKFYIKKLDKCNYTITETSAPKGLTLPSNATQALNACSSNSEVSFTNGFNGLEFQKKNEEGEFLDGGKYALQIKVNNIYKDVLLRKKADGSYEYDAELSENDTNATYIFTTKNGKALIGRIEPGEYRVVEKSAPDGYEAIEDEESTAIITIKDKADYYMTQLINKKVNVSGDSSSAELVVTITTGRRVLNYTLIFVGLAASLLLIVFIRKKIRK